MKIGIITIYEPITNMGSFLQAYALKLVIESMGHEPYFVENVPALKTALKCVLKINPKREFFLRIKKTISFFCDIKKLRTVSRIGMKKAGFDCMLYGSDEIWNMENPYFKDPFFFGGEVGKVKRIAYAVSAGAMKKETLYQNLECAKYLSELEIILVRDIHTRQILLDYLGKECKIVCDPTLLVPVSELSESITCPKEKYLLVYTYGVDKHMEKVVVDYARKYSLKIVSPCFWHLWADKVIECSALQFSTLIQGAECVFTTTFHGAIFTLLNHKRCCIYSAREKVKDVVVQLGEDVHLIDKTCTENNFEKVMSIPFDQDRFENNLLNIRKESRKQLEVAIKCLEK